MKYQNFDLQETLGIIQPLKEGHVTYRVGDNSNILKSLYVPGIGWCPITKELSESYTNLPEELSLFCSEDINNAAIHTWVGKSHLKTIYGHFGWDNPPCVKFDIYIHYMNVSENVYLRYNSIKAEVGCEHLPVVIDENTTYNYFIVIRDIIIYASDEIVKHIEAHGFEDVRINSNILTLTPEAQRRDYEEYDRLQILLNGYKPKKVKYMGKKPYYFTEECQWREFKKHHLLLPNDIIEVRTERKKHVFEKKIEAQLEELVLFFMPMHFSRSSQLSNYVAEHRLGWKYPDLSGYLELTNGDDTWELEGAIHPDYYAEVCYRLGLDNENSNSIPGLFESFAERG